MPTLPTLFNVVGDGPENRAVLAVYRPIQAVINAALWLCDIANGDDPSIPEEPPGVMIFPSPVLLVAPAAAEEIRASLADQRIRQLDAKYFKSLRNAANLVLRASEQDDLELFWRAAAMVEEAVNVVDDYRRALLECVFGPWGRFWFGLAARH